ncbi:MAG TPA: phosphotransferase [Chloroflexota bacterium]|nr:phosphotransferase [Chloroflexota bacterium]
MEREAIEARLRDLSHTEIARIAAAALETDRDAVRVTDWQWEPLRSSLGIATAGLYRLRGSAIPNADIKPSVSGDTSLPARNWSAVLKVIRPPHGTRHDAHVREPSHWAYWKREPLFYTSDLVPEPAAQPHGLAAPRCLLVEELGISGQADDSIWLWLQELVDTHAGWWPPERTLLAARHIGAFGGAFLNRPPTHSWLARRALRQRIDRAPAELPLFQDDTLWQHPLLRPHFEPTVGAQLRTVWTRRWELVDRLDTLPRTLCHGDCHRGNLFAIEQTNGSASHAKENTPGTAAIDWGAAGIGPLGADLAELALSRAIAGDLLAPGGAHFGAHLFASYLDGLRAATSVTDAEIAAARAGYALTAALTGTSRLHWTLERTLDVTRRPEPDTPRPSDSETDDLLRRWAALTRMFLSLGA